MLTSAKSLLLLLLAIQTLLLGYAAYRDSPAVDEIAHLPAGVSHLELGRFDLYNVNPPLVRTVAALPVVLVGCNTDWRGYHDLLKVQCDFLNANGTKVFAYFTLGRLMCIPFCLVGTWICYRWAEAVYGTVSGFVAAGLWCFSPCILGNGHFIMPDVPAAALGACGCYVFWRWLQHPNWALSLATGVFVGLAELTKSTWILLFLLLPIMWLGTRVITRCRRTAVGHAARLPVRVEAMQLTVALLVVVFVLNLGYGFEGSFSSVRSYQFLSETARSIQRKLTTTTELAGAIPVSLPRNYVLGIDRQRLDFERQLWSYLRGSWRQRGWIHFYVYAAAIKIPLGGWGLFLLAAATRFRHPRQSVATLDEFCLLMPAIVLFLFVSSQTGFSHHFRYMLPAYPFVIVWVSQIGRLFVRNRSGSGAASRNETATHSPFLRVLAVVALASYSMSSLWAFPHSLSYFNESIGGPTNGYRHLLFSNVDYGQDLFYLRDWLRSHPEVDRIRLATPVPHLIADAAGIAWIDVPNIADLHGGVELGWYAVSSHMLRHHDRRQSYLEAFQPTAHAGYSILIYHIQPSEANTTQQEPGPSRFPGDAGSQSRRKTELRREHT